MSGGIPRDLPRRIEGYGGGTLGKAYDPFLVEPMNTVRLVFLNWIF